jgi:hypothetical protein
MCGEKGGRRRKRPQHRKKKRLCLQRVFKTVELLNPKVRFVHHRASLRPCRRPKREEADKAEHSEGTRRLT